MSLEVSKIHFPPHISGLSSTTIKIQNNGPDDIILKLRSSQPKRFHIDGSHRKTPDGPDLFAVESLSNISIKVSANLCKVPPSEKDRNRGYTLDRFQILYCTVTGSVENLNIKQQWDDSKKHAKPLEQVVDCIVDLPTVSVQSSNLSHSTESSFSDPVEFSLSNSGSMANSTSLNSSGLSARPKRDSKRDSSTKPGSLSASKDNTALSRSSELRGPNPHAQFQSWHHIDLKELRVLSWQGLAIIFLAFLIGFLSGR